MAGSISKRLNKGVIAGILTAAALCAQSGATPRGLDVKGLRRRLVEQNAVVGLGEK